MLNIRQASIADINTLAILFDSYRQFYQQTTDLPIAKTFIAERIHKQQAVIFLAENLAENETKKLIGFCQIYPSFCSVAAAKIGILYDLFVDASARNVGAGRALMLAAQNYAKKNGMVRLDLTTAKDNLKALAIYHSLDWQRDDIFFTYSKEIR